MRSAFGHINKDKNKWRVRWSEHGVRRSKSFATKADAVKFQAQMSLRHGSVNSSITFSEYWDMAVMPSMSRLTDRTRADYDYTWERIKPHIGDMMIADMRRVDVQRVVDAQSSPSAQRHAIVLIRKICNLAIADDIIIKNPVTRHIQRDKENKLNKKIYSREELCVILRKVHNTEFALPILMMLCAGLRTEEAMAINKRDVDFGYDGYALISVDKAITEVKGKLILKEPKTSNSKRLVALGGDFVDYLIANKRFAKNRRTIKEYSHPSNMGKRWRRFCKNNGLEYSSFRNMRSCYATLCAEAGCLDSIVCQAMGHSGHSMKERNYQSMTIQGMLMNADCFSEYVGFKFEE